MAHEGELRKIRKQPFITHPVGSARIASEYDSSNFVQIASLLHDVVDMPLARERLPLSEVRLEFGLDMVLAIASLSKTLKPMSDDAIKLDYLKTTQEEKDPLIQIVRSADKIHNLESAIEELQLVQGAFWRHFKGGRRAYLQWPADVLRAIEASGAIPDHEILRRYEDTMQRFYEISDDIAS
jgi:(p)ppGpp synthase/HD superfamily hydrolase